jgi:hypothetical protein
MRYLISVLLLFTFVVQKSAAQCCQGPYVDLGPSANWWQCTRQYGLESGIAIFAIIQVYDSNYGVNINAVPNGIYARAAGYNHVSGVIKPCYSCGNPVAQVADSINNLINNNVTMDQLWIYVGDYDDWSSYPNNNIPFLHLLVNQSQIMNMKVGIWSSADYWNTVTNNTVEFNNLDLWYSLDQYYSYPAPPMSFSDYNPFGGWVSPTMKYMQFIAYNQYIPSTCKTEQSNSGINDWYWGLNYAPN